MPKQCEQCGLGGQRISGWLFDIVEQDHGVDIWIISEDGKMTCWWDDWFPSLFVLPARGSERAFLDWVSIFKPLRVEWDLQREVFTQETLRLLRITTTHKRYKQLPRDIRRRWRGARTFTGDLSPSSYYCYETGLFPLARLRIFGCKHGRLTNFELRDTMGDTDYAHPPLETMRLTMKGELFHPRMQDQGALIVEVGDTTWELEPTDPRELLETLRDVLVRHDPDVIFTRWGDDELMPTLNWMARKVGVKLPWNRKGDWRRGQERSYWTYGKVVHRAGAWYMQGRWHIDERNSFLCSEAGLDGIAEVARISQIPVQRMARSTIGTAMSSMELSCAVRDSILIPMDKAVPESIKTARQLVISDKGGLVFQPIPGVHEDVVELDFVSMYPTIMVRYNISPETVGCKCCKNAVVPELGYNVCEKHVGIVPRALETILHKRATYKIVAADPNADPVERARAEACQNALKWILVTCFGYLGYKNARFGKIEAHEAVTAYGREILLTAKDLAEERGFEFMHGIVDAIWIRKRGVTDEEVTALQKVIEQATNVPIKEEGHYRWVAFLASRRDRKMPVANRYFGVFQDASFKVRGIEWRRHDAPICIKETQEFLMDVLSKTHTEEEGRRALQQAIPELAPIFEEIASGRTPFRDLAIKTRLSRDPMLYKVESYGAIAAKELLGRGVEVAAGQMVAYIITDAQSKDPTSRVRAFPFVDADWSPDLDKYVELMQRAIEAIAHPFGLEIEITQDAEGQYDIIVSYAHQETLFPEAGAY